MKPLPRAKLGNPGTISPKSWNILVDTIEDLRAQLARITPKSSGDIIHRASQSGFTSHLTRHPGTIPDSKVPFWPTLTGNATDGYKLTMKKGWVSSTHWKYGVNSIITHEVTSIPGDPDPVYNALSVVSGSKIYCTLTESVIGEITAATISSGLTWPDSSAAKLTGGNDQTGAAGVRYIRLCEVVTVDGSVKVKPIHTGTIEHSAPVRSENTSNSMSGDQARVLKEWDSATAQWKFRYLNAGDGVDITENTNSVTIAATSAHPWKVTNGGSGNATIAAGFMQGYYLSYAAYDPNVEPAADGIKVPESIVAGFSASYAGGNLAITGTQYIYAEMPRNGPTVEYSESKEEGDVTVFAELYDDIEPSPGDAITMIASSDGPETFSSTAGKAARCIAKVTNTAGVITVDAQYVHNNPDMFLPVINVGGNLAIA